MVILLAVFAIPQLLFLGCSSSGQTVTTCGDAGDAGCTTTTTGGGGW